jgi:hypothetical protein
MPNVTRHAEVQVMVAILRMQDALDDGVLVEVVADQVPDVALRPRRKVVVSFRAEVQNEVGEMSSLAEAASESRGNFTPVVLTVQRAERVNSLPVEPGAVLFQGVLDSAGASWQRIGWPDINVGRGHYNTHGSFAARRECRMNAEPHYYMLLSLQNFSSTCSLASNTASTLPRVSK